MSEDYFPGIYDTEFERLKFQRSVWEDITRILCTRLSISKGTKCLVVGADPGLTSFDLREIIEDEGELKILEPAENFLNHIKLNSKINNRGNINKSFTSYIPGTDYHGIINEVEGKNVLFK